MFCPKCGNEVAKGHKFCAKCGAKMPEMKDEKKVAPVATKPPTQIPAPAAAPAPAPAPAPVPQPAAPVGPKPDVKDIIKSPLKVMAVEETVDFTAAEHALESGGLKVNAFSGLFSRPQPTELRVESLTKVYEPIHMVRATYEGTFEVTKEFNLALDADTTKVEISGKVHDVTPVTGSGGMFGGSSNSLKLVGNETIHKRVEKGLYYDMNGISKNQIEQYIKGKKVVSFDPKKSHPRAQVLGTQFDPSNLADKVITPDIVQRVQNAKKTVKERITVDVQTIYYPKYKALITNLKNSQQKYLIVSAVDKSILPTETF